MTLPGPSGDLRTYLRSRLDPPAGRILADCLAEAIQRRRATAPETANQEALRLLAALAGDPPARLDPPPRPRAGANRNRPAASPPVPAHGTLTRLPTAHSLTPYRTHGRT